MSKYSGIEVFEAYARIITVNQYVEIYMNLTGKKDVIQAEKLGNERKNSATPMGTEKSKNSG